MFVWSETNQVVIYIPKDAIGYNTVSLCVFLVPGASGEYADEVSGSADLDAALADIEA
jgi:hypothetical protein